MLDLIEMNLTENKALIFTVYLPSIRQNKQEFWICLSDQEKEEARKFRTEFLKDQYVLSHGFLRKLLSCYVEREPDYIEYEKNKYGKPFLTHDCRVQFNMSHSKDFAAYIIALDCEVGIDIEWMDKEMNIQDISDLVLSPSELLYLKELSLREKQEKFYTIWTKKEAIIKAIGKGLSYSLQEITVMDSVQISQFYHEVNQNRVYYRGLENLGSYAGAVAFSHKIDTLVGVTHRNDGKKLTWTPYDALFHAGLEVNINFCELF